VLGTPSDKSFIQRFVLVSQSGNAARRSKNFPGSGSPGCPVALGAAHLK
jgi:hypothetical protein